MNWREFVASIIASLAWPVGAAVLAWLLRDQLRALFDRRPTSLKAGPFEATWAQAAEDVAENVVALGAAAPDTHLIEDRDLSQDIAQLTDLAEKAPAIAVRAGYRLVERELRTIARQADIEVSADTTSQSELQHRLIQSNLVDHETVSAIAGLTDLRNLAAATDDGSTRCVTAEHARGYFVLLEAVLFALRHPKTAPA